ncbi:DnaJ-class molecular chaperone with C-terminal Zn finger domain [Synechococcus sp. PCC 7502]|uniref:J domain-containing protein n=1 Tax=Synechococcus sp. PCC 7502 TaxID=1173263 RepID=UPI00029FCDA0|nr:DnaJ domain-containing protein [Synechococcus sp. PCC 7502]AFY74189.1 DnaJ-class molecular chaperone with C-terminal Zn finger domain [Synechococcus sp. PCC 7502]
MQSQEKKTSFEISQGICQYNSHDYYAILGTPITADITRIRRAYLNIARILHPDTYGDKHPPSAKNQATQYLAKLVNPAYTFLMAEKERDEYSTILRLLAKRIIKQGQKITPSSDAAKNLLYSPSLSNYERAVEVIAAQQYQDLDKALERTGLISELNLVYILHQEGYQPHPEPKQVISAPVDHNLGAKYPTNPRSANNYPTKIKIAEEYIAKKQWMLAIKELREYLQIDNHHSYCHALLGLAYMNQKLDGMAKMSFQQALKLNPQEPIALANINKIPDPNSQTKPSNKSEQKTATPKKGGFFGWLGGG